MALVLSLHEGEDFFVGDTQVVIGERVNQDSFKVKIGDLDYTLSPGPYCEVLNDIRLRASINRSSNHSLRRVEIMAPLYNVLKGTNYRKGKNP